MHDRPVLFPQRLVVEGLGRRVWVQRLFKPLHNAGCGAGASEGNAFGTRVQEKLKRRIGRGTVRLAQPVRGGAELRRASLKYEHTHTSTKER